eukprot:6460732-Amphidinium_carterae.1
MLSLFLLDHLPLLVSPSVVLVMLQRVTVPTEMNEQGSAPKIEPPPLRQKCTITKREKKSNHSKRPVEHKFQTFVDIFSDRLASPKCSHAARFQRVVNSESFHMEVANAVFTRSNRKKGALVPNGM